MAVLQLYEALLVGLGILLVRTGRAPRDGATVLLLEALFLMDAPLLAAECVTASAPVGTGIAVGLAALAAAKLGGVRRAAPRLLSLRAAVLLGAHAAFVLAVPVLAAHLAWARAFGPLALYAFWWATLALPTLRGSLWREARPGAAGGASRPLAAWTWLPAAMAILHLWAVGYIHAIDFRPAFLAPLLLGLAVTAGRDRRVRRVALPALAVLVSFGQGAALGFAVPGPGWTLTPLRLALLGAGAAWAWLAWRDRERWLGFFAAAAGLAGLLGSSVSSLGDTLGRLRRLLGWLVPRDAFGWGVLAVIAAFVLLVAGARRSLRPVLRPRHARGWPGPAGR
jgi:hypothetical protein